MFTGKRSVPGGAVIDGIVREPPSTAAPALAAATLVELFCNPLLWARARPEVQKAVYARLAERAVPVRHKTGRGAGGRGGEESGEDEGERRPRGQHGMGGVAGGRSASGTHSTYSTYGTGWAGSGLDGTLSPFEEQKTASLLSCGGAGYSGGAQERSRKGLPPLPHPPPPPSGCLLTVMHNLGIFQRLLDGLRSVYWRVETPGGVGRLSQPPRCVRRSGKGGCGGGGGGGEDSMEHGMNWPLSDAEVVSIRGVVCVVLQQLLVNALTGRAGDMESTGSGGGGGDGGGDVGGGGGEEGDASEHCTHTRPQGGLDGPAPSLSRMYLSQMYEFLQDKSMHVSQLSDVLDLLYVKSFIQYGKRFILGGVYSYTNIPSPN